MKTLEQIKNEVAVEREYDSWGEIPWGYETEGDDIINEVAKRYAKEVARASLKNAAENATISPTKDWYSYVVNKKSITNESNIPKLL